MTTRYALVLFLVLVIGSSLAAAQTIDHTYIAAVPSYSQDVMDAIGQQRWFFSHASVGGNMMSGMSGLHSSDPVKYQLATSSVGYNSGEMRANDPPATTVPGTVYDCNRSNPGWANKFTIFSFAS